MKYSDYLQTDHWKRLADETKRLAGYRCQVCNSADELNAHHRTYERKGDELQSDLICLCKKCHELFHKTSELQIIWDEDFDQRIYEAIDLFTEKLNKDCFPFAAGEHEGTLSLYFNSIEKAIAAKNILGTEIHITNDFWNIEYNYPNL